MHDWIGDVNAWLLAIATGVAGLIVSLIRKINTNEKQIELLKTEINTREEYRRWRDDELKAQLSEIRTDIKVLMNDK